MVSYSPFRCSWVRLKEAQRKATQLDYIHRVPSPSRLSRRAIRSSFSVSQMRQPG